MKKTTYIILGIIGTWLLLVTIILGIISLNGRPYGEPNQDPYTDMSGEKAVIELDPFDKVVFIANVNLETSYDESDDYFHGVEIRQSDSYSVVYAEAWADGFKYEIADSTLTITLKKPNDFDRFRGVTGDPIVIYTPRIVSVESDEYVGISLHNFDIAELTANAREVNIHDCHVGRLNVSTDNRSITVAMRDSTVVDNSYLEINSALVFYTYDEAHCGTVNVRPIDGSGTCPFRIADLAYDRINVENNVSDAVQIYATEPYSIIPAEKK